MYTRTFNVFNAFNVCLRASHFEKTCEWKLVQGKQSGAAEACWAHNPEVDGSKPSSAMTILFKFMSCSYAKISYHNTILKT